MTEHNGQLLEPYVATGVVPDFNTSAQRIRLEVETMRTQAQQSLSVIGAELRKIRESQSYRESGYKSFDAAVQAEFSFTRQYAYRLIDFDRTNEQLAELGAPLLTSVSQNQLLKPLPSEVRAELVTETLERDGEVTPSGLRESIDNFVEQQQAADPVTENLNAIETSLKSGKKKPAKKTSTKPRSRTEDTGPDAQRIITDVEAAHAEAEEPEKETSETLPPTVSPQLAELFADDLPEVLRIAGKYRRSKELHKIPEYRAWQELKAPA